VNLKKLYFTLGFWSHLKPSSISHKRTKEPKQSKKAEKMAYFPSHLAPFECPKENRPPHITGRPPRRMTHISSLFSPSLSTPRRPKKNFSFFVEKEDVSNVDTKSAGPSRNCKPGEVDQAPVDEFLHQPKLKRSIVFDLESDHHSEAGTTDCESHHHFSEADTKDFAGRR